ncbi:MAG: MFS transporter [Chloroflexota bacterium]|nr:MFS transporter [Chloroflexota bacterium]
MNASLQRLAHRLPFFYGWIVLASASSTQVVRNASASLTLAVFIYPLAADPELGWSRTLIAGAASVGGLAASVLSPLVGWLVDRYGARLVLASSVFIMGLATISLAWATIPVFFYIFYGISRVIFASPIPIGASVVVSRWFIRMRGRTNGILFASHSIGLVAFPLVASAVIAGYSWREAWVVLGALVWIIALIPVTFFIVQQPEDLGLRPDGDPEEDPGQDASDDATAEEAAPAVEEPAWTRREAMKTPALWILAVGVGSLFLVQAGINTHLAALLRDEGLSVFLSGVGLSLSAAFMGAGSLAWGWIAERFPVRYVLAAVAASVALPSLLFLTADTTLEGLAYSALLGFGVGGILSVPPIAYADYYGRRSLGAIRGVTEPFTSLGQAISTVAAGLVFDLTGSYDIALTVFASLGGLTAVALLFARPPVRLAATRG